ncbi:hypothetical protein CYMTET_35813, partial [Cymbomonas tetramitiformis]
SVHNDPKHLNLKKLVRIRVYAAGFFVKVVGDNLVELGYISQAALGGSLPANLANVAAKAQPQVCMDFKKYCEGLDEAACRDLENDGRELLLSFDKAATEFVKSGACSDAGTADAYPSPPRSEAESTISLAPSIAETPSPDSRVAHQQLHGETRLGPAVTEEREALTAVGLATHRTRQQVQAAALVTSSSGASCDWRFVKEVRGVTILQSCTSSHGWLGRGIVNCSAVRLFRLLRNLKATYKFDGFLKTARTLAILDADTCINDYYYEGSSHRWSMTTAQRHRREMDGTLLVVRCSVKYSGEGQQGELVGTPSESMPNHFVN